MDHTGHITLTNSKTESLFGYTKAELAGKDIESLIPERFRGNHPDLREKFFQVPTSRAIGLGRDLYALRKDRSEFPVEIGLSPVQIGSELTVLAVVIDLTLRKLQELQLREAIARAEAAASARDHFLAVLSHELRTPLTPALMLLENLEHSQGRAVEEMAADIKIIKRNIEIEATLIDDLLDLSRLLKGKLTLKLAPLDLHSAIANAAEFCKYDLESKHQKLVRNLVNTSPFVLADATRLRQILWNIIGNAVKYTPEGGQISVSTRYQGAGQDTVEIEISDTGIGMTPETMARIFNPFEQGERVLTEGRGGLGLGLSISKSLVELHHGTITVASAGLNTGSTFTITLPGAVAPITNRDLDVAGTGGASEGLSTSSTQSTWGS